MTQQIDLGTETAKKKSLPLVGQDVMLDIDAELKAFEDAEREKLGLEIEKRWLEDMANLQFTNALHIPFDASNLSGWIEYLRRQPPSS